MITIEIFKLFGSIFIENSEANQALDDTESRAESTGGKFQKLGGFAKAAGGFIAAGVGIAAGAMTGLIGKTTETANEINKFSQVTGMSKEGFQEWDFVMKNFGYSAEQASGDIAALAEKALDASKGAGEGAELFGELGVQVTDASGKLKSQEQIFNETISALQGMEDITKRNALASALLSTTGEELVPVLNLTAEELENMKNNANVISDEDLAKAEQFNEKWNRAKDTLGNVISVIGFKLIPIFESMLEWVVGNMPAIQSTMDTVFNAISTVVNLAVGVFRDYFLPILSQVWTFIQENLIPIFTALFSYMQGNLPIVKEIFTSVFLAIWEVAKTLWSFFKDNILPIFISLYSWIQGHMPTIRETVSQVFGKIKEVVSGVWAFFKDNILPILARLFQYIQEKMPQIQRIFETAFTVIKNVIEIVWGIIENVLLPVLIALWDWVSPYIPKIQKTIETAFDAIFDAVELVVGIFEKVSSVIETAVDWLDRWNNRDAKKKTIEVEERRTYSGGILGGFDRKATGTNYFQGGATLVGEMGPELVALPKGSKISPANETRNKLNNNEPMELKITPAPVIIDKRVLGEVMFEVLDQQLERRKQINARAKGVILT